MKRIGVFCFYNKNGIVDKSIEVLLSELVKNLSEIIVVCNGNLTDSGHEKLEKYSSSINIRDNKGCDAGAYKDAFLNIISKEKLKSSDEVLIFNDTFYGPFFSLKDIFERMTDSACDFWGMTDYNPLPEEGIPYHLQSYFLVIKKKMLQSDAFQKYWNEMDTDFEDTRESVRKFELTFTKYFQDHGFVADTYVKTQYTGNPYTNYPYEIMRDHGFPFLKKKSFFYIENSVQIRYSVIRALKYIEKNTSYDKDIIYADVLNMFNIVGLKKSMQLAFVLEDVMDIFHAKEETKILFLGEKKQRLEHDFDLENDLKKISEQKYVLVYLERADEIPDDEWLMTYDNLILSDTYVQKIRRLLDEHSLIGCLLPSVIIDGANVLTTDEAFTFRGCAWFRKECLKKMKDSGITMEMLDIMSGDELAEAVQKAGYFTCTVENAEFAHLQEDIYRKITARLMFHLSENYEFKNLDEAASKLYNDRLHGTRIRNIIKKRLG